MTTKSTLTQRSGPSGSRAGSDFVPDLSYHLGLRPRPAIEPVLLTIGHASVRFHGFDSLQSSIIAEQYGLFADASSASDPRLDLQVAEPDRAEFLVPRGATERYRVELRSEAGATLACSYDWAGWFSMASRVGGFVVVGSAGHGHVAFSRALENFLRVVYAHLALERGGLLLHSAALVRNGLGYLLAGPSGSGKTTACKSSPDATLLSDDMSLLLPGDCISFRAHPVPFRGACAPETGTLDAYPVGGVFKLVQDTSDSLEWVAGARGLGEVVGCLPFVTERYETSRKAVDIAAGLVKVIPVARLHLRKGPAFWQTVDAACRSRTSSAIFDDFPAVGGIKQ